MVTTGTEAPEMAKDVDEDLSPAVRSVVAAARRRFRERLPEKLEDIERACRSVGRDADALEAARRAVHTIAGSAATFGYPRLSDAALDLEIRLVGLRGAAAPAKLQALGDPLRTLRAAAAEDERLTR
jgi:chemotaxis protein histidine kinase CheA